MLKQIMVHLVKQVEHLDDGEEITITGSVPMVEGLDVGVGYYDQDTATVTTGAYGQDEGTAYIKYSTGPVSLGYQKGVVSDYAGGGAETTVYDNEYIGISYKISDDYQFLTTKWNQEKVTIVQI